MQIALRSYPWSTKPTFQLGELNARIKKSKVMPLRCCFAASRSAVCQTPRHPGSMAEVNTSVGCRQAFISPSRAMRFSNTSIQRAQALVSFPVQVNADPMPRSAYFIYFYIF